MHAYLDGEIRLEDLPPALQEKARGWDLLLSGLDDPAAVTMAPVSIEAAVMGAVSAGSSSRPDIAPEGLAAPQGGVVDWLLRPRSIRVSPLVGGLAAAALVAIIGLLPGRGTEGFVAGVDEDGTVAGAVMVQFVLNAPGAQSVAVAGDFNDWEGGGHLSDPDGDGIWTGRIHLRPGVHQYMFVVNGEEWVVDPGAEAYRDDGFGSRNAVVTVQSAI